MTVIDFLNIIRSLNYITEEGFSKKIHTEELIQKRTSLENKFDEFKLCCEWIKKFSYEPSKKQLNKMTVAQTYSSYYLKHLVEQWSGKYISNGAFIAAAIYLEVPYRRIYGTPDISVSLFIKENALIR